MSDESRKQVSVSKEPSQRTPFTQHSVSALGIAGGRLSSLRRITSPGSCVAKRSLTGMAVLPVLAIVHSLQVREDQRVLQSSTHETRNSFPLSTDASDKRWEAACFTSNGGSVVLNDIYYAGVGVAIQHEVFTAPSVPLDEGSSPSRQRTSTSGDAAAGEEPPLWLSDR